MEKTFRDFYEFPLHIGDVLPFKTFCADSRAMAYDVTNWNLPLNAYQELLEIINGTRKSNDSEFWDKPAFYISDGCKIYNAEEPSHPLIIVRGWGRLTGHGVGGNKLPEGVAKQIQDDFVHYIIEKLNNKKIQGK